MVKSLKQLNWALFAVQTLKATAIAGGICLKGHIPLGESLICIGIAVLGDVVSFLSSAEKELVEDK